MKKADDMLKNSNQSLLSDNWRKLCKDIFNDALQAVDPYKAVHNILSISKNRLVANQHSFDLHKYTKIIVLGAGKAAYTMASATQDILGNTIDDGLVITKTGHGQPLSRIKVVEGTHPLPSEANFSNAKELIKIAENSDKNTLVIFLMSGGASALLPAPVAGISLDDKLKVTKTLLDCGATIHEINCIRKHLSALKGGRLLKLLQPATTISLVLSDVVGDDLNAIGSGPLTNDPTTFSDALNICKKYDLEDLFPASVMNYLNEGASHKHEETLSEKEEASLPVHHLMIGTNSIAVEAAAKKARDLGFETTILSTTLEGEAKELAGFFAALLSHRANLNEKRPLLLIGGGETTVSIQGTGLGGRNQEFALSAIEKISKIPNAFVAGFATDGTDGPTDAAGAWCDYKTLKQLKVKNLNPQSYLKNNDAYHLFKEINDLIITGPTGTNVCDIYLAGLLP